MVIAFLCPAGLRSNKISLEIVPCREHNTIQRAIVAIVQFACATDVLDTDTHVFNRIPHEIGMDAGGLLGHGRAHKRVRIVSFGKPKEQA